MALPWAENKIGNDNDFVIINTNARSLKPKINSFIDCFSETEAQLAIVTETWFGDSSELEGQLDDLLQATGIAMLCRNRPPVGGLCHSGVAIGYRASQMVLRELHWPNPENFEVICAAGNLRGHAKKVFVLAAYMPTGDPVARGRACLAHIRDMVQMAKQKYNEPLKVVAGDFNQWDISCLLYTSPSPRD